MYNYINEKQFAEKLLTFEENLNKAKKYIKEQFNVDSEYDAKSDLIYIWSNENANLDKARNHILEKLGEDFIDVIYGRKK